jgi:hypothetical protein
MASYGTKFAHSEWVSTDHVRRVWESISIFHEIISTRKILQWLEDIGTSNTDKVNPIYEAEFLNT